MRSSTKLTLNYGIFALVAALANIFAQDLVVRIYSGAFHVLISIILGTGVGLFVKYSLDKRYIFNFKPRSAVHDARVFMLYTVMGGMTTMIFWGFELGFQYYFESKGMRYLGGCIGLAIGYLSKYHLDKHFVFSQEIK
ncbi:GtrA-like protein [Delftia tsuruhatensis]|uniref:GtrA family protein n=1 Tax=Delftia tsuruhatensis TaxID=180282 RepID=UPI001E7D076F|nr:GtrA family protein [Delftia tsuruhatensis]CAB5701118.1 GtrA-like protein [Delftia tsuruhatensis]CAC9693397.1 GtrA-like protein [Delftia tsuruhatensis]